jgi:Cu/Ag efflux protein CusF
MSKKIAAPAALVGMVLMSAGAFAATQTKAGEIKSTDPIKRELTLSSGDTFELPTTMNIAKLKAGEKVSVTYESKDGKMVASKVHVTK